MAFDAQTIIQKELDAGETLLWSGIPKQGTILRGSDALMIPFSLLWGGFAIYWEVMALSISQENADSASMIFPIFGLPFVAVGLYMIFGRFIHDARRRANTFYGLTDQRAIIVSGLFSKAVKSLNLSSLSDLSLNESGDKSGTITFGHDNPFASLSWAFGLPGMGGNGTPKFELIANAKEVYNKLRRQRAGN